MTRRRLELAPGLARCLAPRLALYLALSAAGCALPVVSAGTFLPAGDLEKGELHASMSLEMGRVLASPSDAARGPNDPQPPPQQTAQWEVSTWIASDASLRWQATHKLALEVQVKLSNPVVPFTPKLVGGALGARLRLVDRQRDGGFALELGLRAVGVSVDESLRQSSYGRVQTDQWTYRALGLEAPLVATYRINPLCALTASPFLRVYWIRASHSVVTPGSESQQLLDWTAVLSGGLGVAAALDLGPVELSPGVAFEIAHKPGPSAATKLLFQPGLSVGTRF